MPRDNETVTHFRGIDTLNSVLNVTPDRALDCQNVYVDDGGYLIQAQQPTILIDWSNPANAASDLSPVKSFGILDIASTQPRALIQQGPHLFVADAPGWTDITPLAAQEFGEDLDRLDYVLSNLILYFSTDNGQGKMFPGDSTYYRWGIARPAQPPSVQGTAADPGLASTSMLGVTSISRSGGVTTIVFSAAHHAFVGQAVIVDPGTSASLAPWPSTFVGTFRIATVPNSTTLTFLQPSLPDDAGPYPRAAYPTTITSTQGYQWGVSLGYSRNGRVHWSTLSPYSPSTGPFTGAPAILSPPTDDPQVNQAAFFRNLDGGGDWYLEAIVPIPGGGDFPTQVAYIDTMDDATLLTSGQTPPYDNGIAPNGRYLCPFLDRIMMCGIDDDPTTVRFTGYDSINFGNPQESWCQFNGISIGQGQSSPIGMGRVRYGGLVLFCSNRRMYLLRGTLNDITVSAPTSLSYTVEDLPYEIGCYSHFSIQATPNGLVWLDDGLNLRLYDPSTFYPPKLIAPNLVSFFRRMTPGLKDVITSGYINLLKRDWYIISVPVDGSLTPNLTLLIDTDPDPAKNGGCWPLFHSINALAVAKYLDGSTHLLAAQSQLSTAALPPTAGYFTELPLVSSETNGIQFAQDNPLMPDAYWKGGYHGVRSQSGEDQLPEIKFFRFTRLSTGLTGLSVSYAVADGQTIPFDQPITGECLADGRVLSIGKKGRVCSLTFHFPTAIDGSGTNQAQASPLLAHTISWRVTGVR